MTLGTGDNCQLFGLCLLGCGNHGAAALCINGNRFLKECVYAIGYGILELIRAECRGCGEDNHIHTAVDNLLVCVKTHKFLDARHIVTPFCKVGDSLVYPVFKHIAKGGEFYTGGCLQHVCGSARTTSAAADKTGLEFAAVCGLVVQNGKIIFTGSTERKVLGLLAAARR